MHSAFAVRNLLFLAPLHSPQLRGYCDVACGRAQAAAALRFRRHLPKHCRLRRLLRRGTTLPYEVIFIICVHQRISAVSKLFLRQIFIQRIYNQSGQEFGIKIGGFLRHLVSRPGHSYYFIYPGRVKNKC